MTSALAHHNMIPLFHINCTVSTYLETQAPNQNPTPTITHIGLLTLVWCLAKIKSRAKMKREAALDILFREHLHQDIIYQQLIFVSIRLQYISVVLCIQHR